MTTEPGIPGGAGDGDPAPVECSVLVEAEPETVFPYFTDPSRIVNWMGERATLSPEPGGVYRVELDIGFNILGEFVEVDPPRRVVFSWGWDHDDTLVKPGTSTVEVDLEPTGEGTRVMLRHHKLSGPSADQHEIGWIHYLERLRIAAGGGDPGPDAGPQVPDGQSDRP
ncbi:MAG TPA: SRPBCC domain-containing protein [Solirubrobacterales bacterium]|nr:SRPBCC domain-containing protein [Solirubrobacterales bacterium]